MRTLITTIAVAILATTTTAVGDLKVEGKVGGGSVSSTTSGRSETIKLTTYHYKANGTGKDAKKALRYVEDKTADAVDKNHDEMVRAIDKVVVGVSTSPPPAPAPAPTIIVTPPASPSVVVYPAPPPGPVYYGTYPGRRFIFGRGWVTPVWVHPYGWIY